jgi:hypothetical protein
VSLLGHKVTKEADTALQIAALAPDLKHVNSTRFHATASEKAQNHPLKGLFANYRSEGCSRNSQT